LPIDMKCLMMKMMKKAHTIVMILVVIVQFNKIKE
jgi:hypothetical protein